MNWIKELCAVSADFGKAVAELTRSNKVDQEKPNEKALYTRLVGLNEAFKVFSHPRHGCHVRRFDPDHG
jgi:hypothetical protein